MFLSEVGNSIMTKPLLMTSHCSIHIIWLCFLSSYMDNQSKCKLGDYGEENRQ